MFMTILIAICVYLVLAIAAVILDQMSASCKLSAKADLFIDDFVHLVFFDFHHFH